FVKQEIQEEIYKPEGTIRSQQTTETTSTSTGPANTAGGEAGVEENIEEPDGTGGAQGNNSSSEEAKNITNYEISKKIVNQKDGAFATINKVSAAVTFDSGVLKDIQNKDEFTASLLSIVEDTIGFDAKRGDKVTVKDFKFLGFEPKLDEQGQPIKIVPGATDTDLGDDANSMAMIKSLLRDFGEYIQYLIAAILLFIFYKKFIVSHEVVILGDKATASGANGSVGGDGGIISDYEHEFDVGTAHGRLKAKVKSQIMNNIDGLDEEDAAKYEVLIEQLDKDINDNPEQIAEMIEMLIGEGDGNFKKPSNKG
ncbi:MAG: flagellar M-ring protein FliF C-terminal domain-containing protein, partial [Campylobacterota bacterium]|nr:flagellar M-ring protein FliF C-terminal domain-containing protein [Campylobacterota bacterium]